jgi:hypothetical protein
MNDLSKEFSTLRAQAALRGHCLVEIVNPDAPPSYFIFQGVFTKELPTLEDVRTFVKKIGGAV